MHEVRRIVVRLKCFGFLGLLVYNNKNCGRDPRQRFNAKLRALGLAFFACGFVCDWACSLENSLSRAPCSRRPMIESEALGPESESQQGRVQSPRLDGLVSRPRRLRARDFRYRPEIRTEVWGMRDYAGAKVMSTNR